MEEPIYLKLNTHKGVITLPFKNISAVDSFTIRYKNMGDMVNRLINLLNLDLDLYDVNSAYLTYDKYNIEIDEKSLPIKYIRDNFNFQSLKEALAKYIEKDPTIIYETDLRYVKTREVLNYFDGKIIDKNDIDRIVRAFFENTGYQRRRDTYFMIKEKTDIKVDIDVLFDEHDVDRRNLGIYSTGGDDYLNHLIATSKKSEEDFQRAMDEIGQHDLEEISNFLHSDGYGIVDGVSDRSLFIKKDIAAIEEATGLSIEELRNDYTRFGRKRRSRR